MLSFCPKALISRGFWLLSAPAARRAILKAPNHAASARRSRAFRPGRDGVSGKGLQTMDYTKMRRADRAMRREAALETIDRCTFGTLAMCAPDGHAVRRRPEPRARRRPPVLPRRHRGPQGRAAPAEPEGLRALRGRRRGRRAGPDDVLRLGGRPRHGAGNHGRRRKAPGAAPALRALRAEHSGGKDFVHRERPPLTPRSGASKSNR